MSYATLRGLLIPLIALHNLEEWLTFPAYGTISPALAQHGIGPALVPPWAVLQVGWILVTVLPALLVGAAIRARRRPLLDAAVCWVAALYLANALLPHLLDLVWSRRYAPGVASAVLLNLPLCSLLLRQAASEGYLRPRQLAAVTIAGFATLMPVVVAVLWVSAHLVAAFA